MKSYALPSVSSLLHYCGLQCPPIQGREKCCFVLHDSRLLGLLCYSEDRRCLFLLKVGELPMDRTTSNRENSTFKIKRFYLKIYLHIYILRNFTCSSDKRYPIADSTQISVPTLPVYVSFVTQCILLT